MLECRIRDMVHVDELQFGFLPRKGTHMQYSSSKQVQEKHHGWKMKLYYAHMDLEKALIGFSPMQ